MARDLTRLFSPRSVAVIGASNNKEKLGAIILKNIIDSGFTGSVYPVNPNTENITGLKCFKDVLSLPEIPDLALMAIPAEQSVEVLQQVGEAGIKNVVCFAAGFKESGAEGERLERKVDDISRKYDLNLLGPNCFGFVNNFCPINATFGNPAYEAGNLRFITQSGALAAALFDWCRSQGLGFSQFVTLGNKTVLNENDVLKYFRSVTPDLRGLHGLSDVQPIGLYLESITEGREFLKTTAQMAKKDPIFILIPGETPAGASAIKSHTGSIATENRILDAVLRQAGVIRCQTLEDFFDLSKASAWENAPVGPKLAIISNAGGPAVVGAEAAAKEGLELANFDQETHDRLARNLPRTASLVNPVDVLGDALADRFAKAAEIVLCDEKTDALLAIITPQLMTQIKETAEALGDLSVKYGKPISCSFIGGSLTAEGEKILNKLKIPSFRFPDQAVSSLASLWRFRKHQNQNKPEEEVNAQPNTISSLPKPAGEVLESALTMNQKTLDGLQANEVISSAAIPTPASEAVSGLDQAISFSEKVGWPVVLKLSSPGLLHKKHLGAVLVDIRNPEQLEAAWDLLERKIVELPPETRGRVKIQVQKEIVNGVEVIVGVKHDRTFGPVLLFGAGGSLAELIDDHNLSLMPVGIKQAEALVGQSKVFSLLKGADGEPPHALDKLNDLIVKLGKIAELAPQIEEIEINPAIVTLNDVWAVDVKVILKQGTEIKAVRPEFQTAVTKGHEIPATTFHYFEFETAETINFKPGQYISVKVENDRINCYSIAGHNEPNKFNLLVDTKPGGPGSKFFAHLKVGDKITFLGPFGVFTLKLDDGAQRLLFLGTGSGIAPLKYMVESILKEHHCRLPVTLYIGLNSAEDVFLKDHFQKLSKECPNFNFKIAVFKPGEHWKDGIGFITEPLKRDIPDAKGCAAYLCGNKMMIADASEILLSRGIPKERIYLEKI